MATKGRVRIMAGQLPLPGFEAVQASADSLALKSVPKLTDGLFFGIFPDAEIAARIRQFAAHLRDKHGLKGQPLRAERLHCTLFPIGRFADGLPPQIVAPALKAAAAVEMPSFDVAFDWVQRFGRSPANGPFVLRGSEDLAGLMALRNALGKALDNEGFVGAAESRFTPHVTLLYDRTGAHAHVADLLAEPLEPVEPVRWTVREFVLVHSLLGRTRHVPIGRWRLLAV